jgi:hypothetical protein
VEQLREVQKREGRSLSAVVDTALAEWFERRERANLERQYRSYYANEVRRRRHRSLANEMAALSTWPEDE